MNLLKVYFRSQEEVRRSDRTVVKFYKLDGNLIHPTEAYEPFFFRLKDKILLISLKLLHFRV